MNLILGIFFTVVIILLAVTFKFALTVVGNIPNGTPSESELKERYASNHFWMKQKTEKCCGKENFDAVRIDATKDTLVSV